MSRNVCALSGISLLLLAILAAGSNVLADDDNVLKNLHTVSTIASTLPANQDVNPYGVARVNHTIGNLTEGHILVSNFNNSGNAQGTGTTIVDVAPNGAVSLFAQINAATLPGPCPGGVGSDDCSRCVAHWLGNRGQPANHRWQLGHRSGWMLDRSQ